MKRIKLSSLGYRYCWLALILVINVVASIMVLMKGFHLGDVRAHGLQDATNLFVSLIAVCSSYVYVFWVNEFLARIKISKKAPALSGSSLFLLSVSFFILQIAYLFIILINDVGAGISEVPGVSRIILVFLPVPYLHMIYYLYCRDFSDRLFWLNLFLAIFICLAQGYSYIFLFLLFFEIARRLPRQGVSVLHLTSFICLFVVLFPLLYVLKSVFRLQPQDGSFNETFIKVFASSGLDGIVSYLAFAFEFIVGRIQMVSLVSVFNQISSEFVEALDNNIIRPFWLEGPHGLLLEKLLGRDFGVSIGAFAAVSSIFDSSRPIGEWVTNVNLFFWFFVSYYGIFVLFYVFVLMSIFHLFSRVVLEKRKAVLLAFYFAIFFLVPPWISSFITFIYSMFLFYLLVSLFSFLQRH